MRKSFDRPTLHRRTVLRTGSAAGIALLSGCSGFLGSGGGTTDPDAGTDSYGLSLQNTMTTKQTVRIVVSKPFEDETIFDETVEIGGGESREWNEVITESEEWAVTAKLPEADTLDRWDSDRMWITPGSEDAPDVENIRIVVAKEKLGSQPMPGVSVTTDSR